MGFTKSCTTGMWCKSRARGAVFVDAPAGQVDVSVHVAATVAEVTALPLTAEERAACVTQTTLSVDDTRQVVASLQQRYRQLVGPDVNDICYATQNRPQALRGLANDMQLMLVVGASDSSNLQRLREVALQQGMPAHLVKDETAIDPAWPLGVQCVGVTAGASTSERLVQPVAQRLRALGTHAVHEVPGLEEHVVFRLALAVLRHAA